MNTRSWKLQGHTDSIDSTSCNIRDTAYLNIRVRSDEMKLDFDATNYHPVIASFRFNNLSYRLPKAIQ
jgi:hypothetical protein